MKTDRKRSRISWRLAICGLLLFWIFHQIFIHEGQLAWEHLGKDWNSLPLLQKWRIGWVYGSGELWNTLSLINPWAFSISLVFMGMTILFGAIRWRMVLGIQGLILPMGRTLEISCIAQFFNAFLLGSTGGDLLKAYYAARETHHKKTEAIVTVFVDRLIGLFSMLIFACLMMFPNHDLLISHERLAAIATFVAAMMISCALLALLAFWGGLSRRWPNARDWLRRLPKGEYLERSIDACRSFGKEKSFLIKSMAISMLINVLCVLQVSAVCKGLGVTLEPKMLFLIVPSIICISALPVTPSGLGVRENLFVWMLAVPEIGIESTKALSISLLTYSGFLFWSLVGGLVYMSVRESQHLDEITQEETEINNS